MTESIQVHSNVQKHKFREISESAKDPIASLASDYGTVYVTSITRDGCSGCMEQKPLFEELANKVAEGHPGRTVFNNIHVRYENDDASESEKAKTSLHHVAYPTYLVSVRSRFGVLEAYRAVYPKMEELEKQIAETFDTAEYYQKDQAKTR